MTIHKCDMCKKELYGSWLTIKIDIDALHPETNVARLIPLKNKLDICESCYYELKNTFINFK